MTARQIVEKTFQCLVLLVAVGYCYTLYDNEPILVAARNNRVDDQLSSSPAPLLSSSSLEPQYVWNRTCNAHRLYALDTHTHYDHFAKERCGRYVSHLIIRRSVIRYIPANFFIHKTSFEYLITLKMDNVSLKAIYPQNFENISYLEILHLPSNQIEHLPAGIFRHLPALHTVDLSKNLIATVDADAFRECVNMQELNMKQNWLTVLNPKWFRSMNEVKFLDFSDNFIESDFDGDIFSNANGLQLLMRNNRIRRILSFGSKKERAIFRLVDLSGNTLRPPYPIIPRGNHNMSLIY